MSGKGTKPRFLNRTTVIIAGLLPVFLLAAALLWHGNATSRQALPPLVAQVYFDGEYRIADGE